MPEDKLAVPDEPLRSGRETAAAWAMAEARASIKRIGVGMLLLALVLLLGATLTSNPEVSYSLSPGHSVGSRGWSGLIPPLPPSAGAVGTMMNWLTFLIALLVTLTSALCRFLSIASVVSKTSPVVDAVLYGALAAALLAWRSRVAGVLLLLLAGAGLVISGLRLTGAMAGEAGNVIVSILAVIGAIRACQVTAAYYQQPRAGQ
jgi:hypothetical protein